MPTLVTERPYRPVPTDPPRKRWTREECAAFAGTDLWDQQKLELIDGELISKMGKNRPHTNALTCIRFWLIQVFGALFVNSETSIDVNATDNPTSEPEPDVIVLDKPTQAFERNPQPENIRLLVEVSDSSLGFDLTKKAEIYARAGIVEYWVLDVSAYRLVVHREPRDGRYQNVAVYKSDETVSPLAAPHEAFLVRDAFPQLK